MGGQAAGEDHGKGQGWDLVRGGDLAGTRLASAGMLPEETGGTELLSRAAAAPAVHPNQELWD